MPTLDTTYEAIFVTISEELVQNGEQAPVLVVNVIEIVLEQHDDVADQLLLKEETKDEVLDDELTIEVDDVVRYFV